MYNFVSCLKCPILKKMFKAFLMEVRALSMLIDIENLWEKRNELHQYKNKPNYNLSYILHEAWLQYISTVYKIMHPELNSAFDICKFGMELGHNLWPAFTYKKCNICRVSMHPLCFCSHFNGYNIVIWLLFMYTSSARD